MSNPHVLPWSDSSPMSSSNTLKLLSISLIKILNWATSLISADSSKANEKNEHV